MKRALLVNVVLVIGLVGYNLLTTKAGGNYIFGRLAFSGVMILLLVPINLVAGMVRNRHHQPDGKYYILMAGILLLVGFSVCSL